MIKKLLAVGAVLLLIVGIGAAFATGVGPAPGGDSGSDIESFPTETPESSSDSDTTSDGTTGGDDVTATTTGPPFTFTIDQIAECGQTCRDVTTTLTNEQSTADSNVTVYTRIYAGKGTDGDVVWEGTESVGALDAGESYTGTKRVELSMGDAYTIQQRDGWITIQTTVDSDGETMTFTEQRQVT